MEGESEGSGKQGQERAGARVRSMRELERAHVEEGKEMAEGREGEVEEETIEEVGAEEYQGKSEW